MKDKVYWKILVMFLAIFFIFGNIEAYENIVYTPQVDLSNNILTPIDIALCSGNKCYDNYSDLYKSEPGNYEIKEKTLTGQGELDRLNHFMVSPYFINDNPVYKGKKLKSLYDYSGYTMNENREAYNLDMEDKDITILEGNINKELDEYSPEMDGDTWSLWADPLTIAKQEVSEKDLFDKDVIDSLVNRLD